MVAGKENPSVLFVANTPRSPFTGMGRWSASMRRELVQEGFCVEEWYSDRLNLAARWKRMAVLVAPLQAAFLIWRARKRFQVVILHEPLAWPSAILGVLFPHSMPRILAVSHGLESRGQQEFERARTLRLVQPDRSAKWKYAFARKWQNDLGLTWAYKVICMNSADAEYLHTRLGRSRDDLILINNGIDPATEIPPLSTHARNPFQVLMLSQWRDYKGRRGLPTLWRTVLAACPQARLVLIGTLADEQTVRSAFDEHEQHSIVVIPRVHDRAVLQEHLLSSSIFLMPSIHEGSPLAMIEAMACGLAIVGSNAGGIPDLLQNGSDGCLFHWSAPEQGAKSVIDLLTNPAHLQSFAQKARARAENLTWKNAAAPLLHALRHLQT